MHSTEPLTHFGWTGDKFSQAGRTHLYGKYF
jgi:hypothetical protein